MMQNDNGVVYENTVGTLKISNIDDRCIFYIKESLIEYSEGKSLKQLEEYLKIAKNVAVELLPGTKAPLAETYKLAIGVDEGISNDDAKSPLQF